MEFPFWNELFTFSTGFSTVFVKKGRVFHEVFHFFHRVFHNNGHQPYTSRNAGRSILKFWEKMWAFCLL